MSPVYLDAIAKAQENGWEADEQTMLERVSEPYEGGGDAATDETVVTDGALKPLANAYNELANIYNEVYTTAEANGWRMSRPPQSSMRCTRWCHTPDLD